MNTLPKGVVFHDVVAGPRDCLELELRQDGDAQTPFVVRWGDCVANTWEWRHSHLSSAYRHVADLVDKLERGQSINPADKSDLVLDWVDPHYNTHVRLTYEVETAGEYVLHAVINGGEPLDERLDEPGQAFTRIGQLIQAGEDGVPVT